MRDRPKRRPQYRVLCATCIISAITPPPQVLLAYCASFRRRLLLAVDAVVKDKPLPEADTASTSEGARRRRMGITKALDAMRGAFDEAEAFVDKVCVCACVCRSVFRSVWP